MFLQLPARVADTILERPVVSQQQQPFAVEVEPSRRINGGRRYEVGERAASIRVGKLAQDAVGFVQQDQGP